MLYDPLQLHTFPNPYQSFRKTFDYFSLNIPFGYVDWNRIWFQLQKPPPFKMEEIIKIAAQIAWGHANVKHVIKQREFPEVKNRKQYEKLIKSIMSNPTEWKPLDNGRSAYWDKKTRTIVIHDPSRTDKGTAFRANKRYYDENVW